MGHKAQVSVPLRYSLALSLQGIAVREVIADARKREQWSPDRLEGYREEHLRDLLQAATDRFDFYRRRLPGGISTSPMRDLGQVPFLTKEDLKGPLATEAFSRSKRGIPKTTGGSTGEPVRLIKDRRGLGQELGVQWRGYGWHGVTPHDHQARFWSAPRTATRRLRSRLVDWAANRSTFVALDISESTWEGYAERFQKLRPAYLYGYVSMIRDFARFLDRRGWRPLAPPKVVVTTAEPLDEATRFEISTFFSAPVRSEYGCGEVGVIAMECEEGSLHLMSDNLIVEVVDDQGRPVVEGTGRVVVTDLFNHQMPIIRYQLGDVVTACAFGCRCGRPFPVLDNVLGRAYDAITTPDGRTFYGALVTGLFADLTKSGAEIRGYQVVQETTTDIVVRIEADDQSILGLSSKIVGYFRRHLGPQMAVRIQQVDAIPREASGKIRVVKNASIANS